MEDKIPRNSQLEPHVPKKPYFQLPKIKYNPDRYCYRCGNPVRSECNICRRNYCDAPLIGLEIGPAWKFCSECRVGLIKKNHGYCTICDFEKEVGREFKEEREDVERQIMERRKQLKRKRQEADAEFESEQVLMKAMQDNEEKCRQEQIERLLKQIEGSTKTADEKIEDNDCDYEDEILE